MQSISPSQASVGARVNGTVIGKENPAVLQPSRYVLNLFIIKGPLERPSLAFVSDNMISKIKGFYTLMTYIRDLSSG
jgi:hypothetical protein